jgi:hypothetical protein
MTLSDQTSSCKTANSGRIPTGGFKAIKERLGLQQELKKTLSMSMHMYVIAA